MKFLIDECMGKRFHDFLVDEGYNSIFVGDWKRGVSDNEVIDKAIRENRIIITECEDFREMVRRRGIKVPGLIIFRNKATNPVYRVNLLLSTVRKYSPYGKIIIFLEDFIKIRSILTEKYGITIVLSDDESLLM